MAYLTFEAFALVRAYLAALQCVIQTVLEHCSWLKDFEKPMAHVAILNDECRVENFTARVDHHSQLVRFRFTGAYDRCTTEEWHPQPSGAVVWP
jgi:hypothetical protein